MDTALTSSKTQRVRDPHVAPLNRLVESWRSADAGRFVPWFDPDDGGVNARVLVLLERPAPSTVAAGSKGFSSEDNASASSRAFRAARMAAGVDRGDILRWNIVPWVSTDSLSPLRIPEIDDARDALHVLLCALPRLRGIVALGSAALAGSMRYLTLHDGPVVLPVFAAPHPSPANAARRAERPIRIANALRRARDCSG